jgi:O-antigen/teichoic acid export membrane protein
MSAAVTIRRGVGWSYTSYAVEASLGLAVVAVVLRHVSSAEYGALMLALSLASLTTVLDFGLLGLLIPAVVKEREQNGPDAPGRLLSAALGWLGMAGVLAALACGSMAAVIPGPFNISDGLVGVTRQALLLAGAAVLVTFLASALELTHAAFGDFGRISRVQIIVAVSRAAATIAAMSAGYGVVSLAVIHLGAALLRLILLASSLSAHTGGVRVSFPARDVSPLRPLLARRSWATADNIARRAAAAADTIALGALANTIAIATFNVGSRIPGHLHVVATRGIDVTMPSLSTHHARDAHDDFRALFARTIVIAFSLLGPVAAFGILLAPWIVRILGGEAYSGAAPVLQLLLAAVSIRAFSIPSYNLLYATGRVNTAARIGGTETVAKILLAVILIPRYGATGAAFATLVSTAVLTFAWFLPAAMAAAGLRWSDLIRELVRTFRAMIPATRRAG